MQLKTQLLILFVTTITTLSTSAQKPPPIKVCIAGKDSGYITIKELLVDSTLHICSSSIYPMNELKIINFRLSVICRGQQPVLDMQSDHNRLSEKMKKIIAGCRTGDKVFIEMVRVENHGKQIWGGVDPVAFTISGN